jgi:hypothetical protein
MAEKPKRALKKKSPRKKSGKKPAGASGAAQKSTTSTGDTDGARIRALMGNATIEQMALKDLKPAPYNPRVDLQPGMPEYEKLKRSLEHFGYVEKAIWNKRTGFIVGGHQRLKVMSLEWKLKPDDLIDVVVVDLAPVQEKALNVALNKIEGGWDDGKLAEVLAELQNDDSINELVAGFDIDEIQDVFERSIAAMHDDDAEDGNGEGEGSGGSGDSGDSGGDEIGDAFGVMITCRGEAEQRELHDELRGRGLKVRLMVL